MTAPTIPQTAAEFEEVLADGARVQEMIVKGEFGDFTKQYAAKMTAKDEDLVKQFHEQLQQGLRDFLIESGQSVSKLDLSDVRKARAGRRAGLTNDDKGQLHNPKAPGAALDKLYETPVDFFHTAWHLNAEMLPNGDELRARAAKHREIVNAASSVVPSDGGFLIPEILRSEILQLALEGAIVRPNATVIPMDSLKVPIPAVDETSRASSIFGGIAFQWTPEGAPLTDTSAKFGQITLDAKKLTGYAGIPNELLADAPAFTAWFQAKFPAGWGWFEDLGFLTGDGVAKPQGITTAPGAVKVSRNNANAINYDDIVRMYSRMYPASVRNSRWVAAIDTFPQLAELSFVPSGGTTPVPVMLWQMNAIGTPVLTLMGRPIEFTEKVGPLGSQGDLGLYDFSEYLVGDRQAMQMQSSNDYLFGTDKTAIRVIGRVDGQPWLRTALTPANGSSNTLSPYVVLV